jgi:hypothetical protein
LFDQPDALIQMGRSARLVAQRDFDFMKMVRQTEELYLSLMERRGLCVAS